MCDMIGVTVKERSPKMLQTLSIPGAVVRHSPEGDSLQEPRAIAVRVGQAWLTLTYVESTDVQVMVNWIMRTTGRKVAVFPFAK